MACEDLAEIKQALTEAKNAYHKLMLGQMPRVFVDQNGERVEYTSANANRLASYIAGLQQRINACEGNQVSGPLRVFL